MDEISTPDAEFMGPEFDHSKHDGPFISVTGTRIRHNVFGEIYQDLTSTSEFMRLQNIRQLGTVGSSTYNLLQDQTRGMHSWVTAVMMDVVLYKNGFGDAERRLGIASGLYHDLAMVPFSDQGKLLNPGKYEEEDILKVIVEKSQTIPEMLKKHKIDLDELVGAVRGKGVIGKLINSKEGLDIDNLSYLACDQMWLARIKESYLYSLKKIPGIFDQYESLRLVGDDWVFQNHEYLANLIEFRAAMYSSVYNNEANRAKEAFLKKKLAGHGIDFDELFNMRDDGFQNWFAKKFGDSDYADYFYVLREPFHLVAKYYDISKIDDVKNEWEKKGFVVDHLKPPRAALKNKVFYKNEVVDLEEIGELKGQIKDIKKMIGNLNYVGVFAKVDKDLVF